MADTEQKRLLQEEEAARDRYNKSCWEVKRFDDRILALWGELRQRRSPQKG